MNAREAIDPPRVRTYLASVTPAGPFTVLYDGACPFCTGSATAIQRLFGARRVSVSDFQLPGALERYPTLSRDALMQKMHLVTPDGRVFAGAEAFARIAMRVPVFGWFAWLYYVPGVKQLAEGVYRLIARHRYRLWGRTAVCAGDACKVHRPS